MLAVCAWAVTHHPRPAAPHSCSGFACIEKAQTRDGIDRAYTSTFAGRKVDCAAKTWEQGPVVVCRFK